MSATAPVTIPNAKARVLKLYERQFGPWAAGTFGGIANLPDPLPLPSLPWGIALHPPSERTALNDLNGTRQWANAWRSFRLPSEAEVTWENRSWPSIGSQSVPVRLSAYSPSAIAHLAGRGSEWSLAVKRLGDLAASMTRSWGKSLIHARAGELQLAVRKCARQLCSMADDDWGRSLGVLQWLSENPGASCFIRELPILGIDSKWMERHRGTIEPLYEALSGQPFCFRRPSPLVRIRYLDRNLAPSGLTDLAVTADELQHLGCRGPLHRPRSVIICENLTTMCALPTAEGALAVHGGGYRAGNLGEIRWLSEARLVYWGDLDTNGFAILDRFRAHFPQTVSVLMDKETLLHHASLCVAEEKPRRGIFEHLTREEAETLDLLLGGNDIGLAPHAPSIDFAKHALRLEQERVSWPWALERLSALLPSSL